MDKNLPEMYKHQKEIVEKALEQDEIALFHGLGSGKTRSVIESMRAIFNKDKKMHKTLVIGVPSVIYNWKIEIEKFSNIPESRVYVCGSGTKRAEKLKKAIDDGAIVITINYEALLSEAIFTTLQKWKPTILVADECFHSDTLVTTNKGLKKISNIEIGDLVKNCLGYCKVKSVSKKEILESIKITFSGKEIQCSLNHPFLTDKGWRLAKNLSIGDKLVPTNKTMCLLSERVSNNESKSEKILREILLSEVEDAATRSAFKSVHTRTNREDEIKKYWKKITSIFRKNEETQSNAHDGDKRKNDCNKDVKSRDVQTTSTVREWAWSNRTRANYYNADPRHSMECDSPNKHKENRRFSYALQIRSWISRFKVRSRSGWTESQCFISPSTRHQERDVSCDIRVENIEIQKQVYNRGHPENYFYDIGVEGHPSFDVNSILVHNCHTIKNPTAKRSKAVVSLSVGTSKRFILTGTPILRNMMDIFMQFKALDHGKTFGANYFSFRARYFVDKNASWSGKQKHFPLWIPREDTKQELMDKIKKKAHVVETKDCLDLPPLINVNEYVEMEADQKKAYNEMRDYFLTFVAENADNPAIATIAPTKALRLLQIASGHVTLDDGKVAIFKSNPKLKRLMELLEELTPDHKVIVWTVFKQDVRSIETELLAAGIKYVKGTGDETSLEKQKSVDDFQKDPEVRVFLGNCRASGTGLTITQASYSIRFSRNFNLGDELQSAARNYRAGSEIHEKIININLCIKDSIDEHVAKALACKEDIGKNVIEFVKRNS